MAEENFDDFDNNVEFVDEDSSGSQGESQESVEQQQPPILTPQRPRPRPPQRRRPQPPITPQMAAAQAAPMPQQVPQQAAQQANPTAQVQIRYVPYEMPKRIGLLDRVTGKPIIEDEDMLRVVMAQLADLKNDLEEIKSYYS